MREPAHYNNNNNNKHQQQQQQHYEVRTGVRFLYQWLSPSEQQQNENKNKTKTIHTSNKTKGYHIIVCDNNGDDNVGDVCRSWVLLFTPRYDDCNPSNLLTLLYFALSK